MPNWQVGIGALLLGALIGSYPADAVAVVPVPEELVKGDNVLDLTTLDPRLEQLFKEMDDEKLNAKYDLRRKIDRHTIDSRSPMFALHAIGKVTAAKVKEGQPGFEQSARAEENRAWGTGFMFTPCHMMTNHHVVCEKQTIKGHKVCKGNEAINIMGKSANFSFGENESNGRRNTPDTGCCRRKFSRNR